MKLRNSIIFCIITTDSRSWRGGGRARAGVDQGMKRTNNVRLIGENKEQKEGRFIYLKLQGVLIHF